MPEAKADTSSIISIAQTNQILLSDIKELIEGSPAENSSTSELIAIDKVLRYYELEIDMDQSESESATIDMRLLRVLQHYWSASNKRSRSLISTKKVCRLIFWLAHPHKDGKVVDSSKTDLLRNFSDRFYVLAIRMLIQMLEKILRGKIRFRVSSYLIVVFWILDCDFCFCRSS